jgi:tRNA pseudouridine38-40 synthase
MFREEVCPPFDRRFVYHYPYPLDESAMCQAAPLVEGEHDFRAFAASDDRDEPAASKVRTIFYSRVERKDARLVYRVTGSGFLKHMVRNLMGVLIEVGKGNWSAEDVRARLEPASGIAAGPAVPASGLFLISVEYKEPRASASGSSLI